ncbi:hypothetical protein Ddye_025684 [Dipteronia dyeriana]|uniref:VQ domain-containing protein n=1 Tax=Dipteronia dyeriana TaxID=168575 RepID=A0AAD9WNG0_9ROSI|nr:hypothetical protein Ddye_025684 [Dipteronia dyeriana]
MGKLKHHFDDIHYQNPSKNHQTSSNKVKKNPIKVTYISSPMMVKASNASEFRAIVQQLTGKNSHVPADDHDLVSTTASLFTNEEESNHHPHHQALDHQGGENITAHHHQGGENITAHHHHHEYLMDDTFSNNIIMSLLDHDHDDQFDGRFLWRDCFSMCNS